MTLWLYNTFDIIKDRAKSEDGLVLLGCGGDLQEWIYGVAADLRESGVATADFQFEEAYRLETTGGRIDLVLFFDWNKVAMDKFPLWRLSFGDCSWLSDYVVNYADHF